MLIAAGIGLTVFALGWCLLQIGVLAGWGAVYFGAMMLLCGVAFGFKIRKQD
jgi:hypothetical protein